MPDLLTTLDVARLAGVTPATVRRYTHRGSLPKPDRHIGRTPVWERATVDRWLAERPRCTIQLDGKRCQGWRGHRGAHTVNYLQPQMGVERLWTELDPASRHEFVTPGMNWGGIGVAPGGKQ